MDEMNVMNTEVAVAETAEVESTELIPVEETAEVESKKSNVVAGVAAGAGIIGLGILAVKYGPKVVSGLKTKHEAKKQAKAKAKAQAKAAEIIAGMNGLSDELFAEYAAERGFIEKED